VYDLYGKQTFNLPYGFLSKKIFSRAPGLPDGIFSYQKLSIWVNFGVPWNGKCCCILWPFGTSYGKFCVFYGHLVYFVVIWYIL
jgi:hypothetical protein